LAARDSDKMVMFTDRQIAEYIESLKHDILKVEKHAARLNAEWSKTFPRKPGCYVVYESGELVYAGETDNLRRRMGNLRNTTNHVLRRNIGKAKFSKIQDFEPATSNKKFPAHIEKMLNEYIEEKIKVAVMPVRLGRKELEETMVREFSCKYNIRGQKNR